MAVAYESFTTATGTGATVVVPAPSGLAAGDLWVVGVAADDSSCTINTPAGWFAVSAQVNPGFPSVRFFWTKAAGGETDVTVSITGSTAANCAISIRLSGQDPSAPIAETAVTIPGGNVSTVDAPDVTVGLADSLALMWTSQGDDRVITPPSGSTLIGQAAATAGAVSVTAAYELRAAGAYAPGTWSWDTPEAGVAAQTIVVTSPVPAVLLPYEGLFDPELTPLSWQGKRSEPVAWFDPDLIEIETAGGGTAAPVFVYHLVSQGMA